MNGGLPLPVWVLLATGVFVLALHGTRGIAAIRDAVRVVDLGALADPPQWRVTRAFFGACLGLPLLSLAGALSWGAVAAAVTVAALGYSMAPQLLTALRMRVEHELLDHLPLHLDLMALSLESGGSLSGALALAAEHGPAGALRRALEGVLLEIHSGVEPLEALRSLEQRTRLRSLNVLVTALRSAERLSLPFAPVLRERATQAAANRFARAERRARAAPLKLWATLVLCIAPCTLVVLAFPVAKLLAMLGGYRGG